MQFQKSNDAKNANKMKTVLQEEDIGKVNENRTKA